VCNALAAKGFPSSSLATLGPESPDPLGTDVVVATADIRNQFGGRLATVYAPVILASFGSGIAGIEVRDVIPGGMSAYRAALAVDLRSRRTAGAQLLHNSHITVSATARTQLRRGDIDPRLLLLFAEMASSQPVRIVDFGDQGPGSGPGSLLRSVDLATDVIGSHLSARAYLKSMQAWVIPLTAQYRTASSKPVMLPGGETVLRIEYAAPSPLS
jgi:hypothetical protein